MRNSAVVLEVHGGCGRLCPLFVNKFIMLSAKQDVGVRLLSDGMVLLVLTTCLTFYEIGGRVEAGLVLPWNSCVETIP